jgi:hypothetical protein
MSGLDELTPAEVERLTLLIEECAEVQQMATKTLRHGYGSCHPDDRFHKMPNRRLLEKVLGDLLYVISLMDDYADINPKAIAEYKEKKKEAIQEYLHHNHV